MNVPLFWLSDYTKLPKSHAKLTDRLTMIGHMLDKTLTVGGQTVVDLELRGNRSDLFGIIGIARDVSAVFGTKLILPETKSLPKTDPNSDLVIHKAGSLVERFTAFALTVKVGPSPKWLVQKLSAFGLPSINNVVDITNFVMIETGEPMHAYDAKKLSGGKLILRNAKKDEKFTTLLGTTVTLTTDDLAICDADSVVGLTMIGGKNSGISDNTTDIILEAAVYDQACVRKTARRLGVRTEAGSRHEKLLDPNQVPWALERAYKLLTDLAGAQSSGPVCDVYPTKRLPITVDYNPSEIDRLIGIDIPVEKQIDILKNLGFLVEVKNHKTYKLKTETYNLNITVPTFRTDVDQSADLVEEITRIYGYEKVPENPLSGILPSPDTPSHILLEEKIRDIMQNLHTNEIITSSLFDDLSIIEFQKAGKFPQSIQLINPPDQTASTLRPSLVPNLVHYVKRNLSFRKTSPAFFELGKIYYKTKSGDYSEEMKLGIIVAGDTKESGYSKLKGIIEGLLDNLGIPATFATDTHPSLEPNTTARIISAEQNKLGILGQLNISIKNDLDLGVELFVAEISLKNLQSASKIDVKPYILAPKYSPIIEDLTFTLPLKTPIGDIISQIGKLELIEEVSLKDRYKQNFTFTLIYRDETKQLSTSDITPLRKKLVTSVEKSFGAKLIGQI